MPRADLPAGITRTKTGYRVFQWVSWPGYPKGRVRSKRFDQTATVEAMRAWREAQRVDARRRVPAITTPSGDGFLADADRYLEAVQAMPQFSQRRSHVQLWAALFGERAYTTIAPHEIRAQRDAWLTAGPKWVYEQKVRVLKPLPLSPQEVNLRLRALENLWTVLWPNEPNPVRDVPECADVSDPKARGQSFALAREVLAHMPDITRPEKGGAVEKGSLSRIRFETMLMTGLTHKQIGMLKESDVDYTVPSIVPPPRLKGRPSKRRARPRRKPHARPLLPSAVPVLKQFFAMGANRPFYRSSFWRSVKRAVKAANVARAKDKLPLLDETLRPYDWTRHTFGTEVYRRTGDLKMVQELLGHSDMKLSAIYARAAVREHIQAAVTELDKHARRARLGGKVGGKVSPPKQARNVRTRRTTIRRKPQ